MTSSAHALLLQAGYVYRDMRWPNVAVTYDKLRWCVPCCMAGPPQQLAERAASHAQIISLDMGCIAPTHF